MTVKTNKTVDGAVFYTVVGPVDKTMVVYWAVDGAVNRAVYWAVDDAVRLAVYRAVDFALNEDSHHPCLEDFLFDAEVEV